jgi:eukaryotic-like serine/threonine-protein kinase
VGPYTTERAIAQSERFTIYQARRGDELVALKVLRDPAQQSRFSRMMQLAVPGPHAVKIIDPQRDYAAMELVDGASLRSLIVRGPIQAHTAIAIVRQLCTAISAAHAAGIVHGRIAPTHLLHGATLRVLGHRYRKGDKAQLEPDLVKYMPPEVLRGASVDVATDVWSIGVVLFELVEGYKPFDAESYSELTEKLAGDPPATSMRMSPHLSLIVSRCLEKAPERRFLTVSEIDKSLESLR